MVSDKVHPGWSALWDSVKSLFSWSALVALALGFGIAVALKHAASPDLGGTVFGVDATLVALIVPAAALANAYLEGRMLEYLAKILAGGAAVNEAVSASVRVHANRVVACVQPLLRGFTFLLVSLGLSVAGLFKSANPIWPSGPEWFRPLPSDLYIGGALGFDLVGVLLLFPFAWTLLDLELAKKTSKLIDWQAEKYRIENEAAKIAAEQPPAQQPPAERRPEGSATG